MGAVNLYKEVLNVFLAKRKKLHDVILDVGTKVAINFEFFLIVLDSFWITTESRQKWPYFRL